jgi:hypothetical protein
MSEIRMLIGKGTTGDGEVIRLPGRFKQFLASLEGADNDDVATVSIYTTPDGDQSRGVLIATLEINGAESGDISPVIECLCSNYYAAVDSITGGAVWLTGVNEDV